jgi:hypothetical protein
MQYAKPILGVYKYQEIRRIYKLTINAKPNCQTIGYKILRVLAKKQKCQTYLQNCWSYS